MADLKGPVWLEDVRAAEPVSGGTGGAAKTPASSKVDPTQGGDPLHPTTVSTSPDRDPRHMLELDAAKAAALLQRLRRYLPFVKPGGDWWSWMSRCLAAWLVIADIESSLSNPAPTREGNGGTSYGYFQITDIYAGDLVKSAATVLDKQALVLLKQSPVDGEWARILGDPDQAVLYGLINFWVGCRKADRSWDVLPDGIVGKDPFPSDVMSVHNWADAVSNDDGDIACTMTMELWNKESSLANMGRATEDLGEGTYAAVGERIASKVVARFVSARRLAGA